ncbi:MULTISPECIES: nuclease A inhibitor family protein [Spirosoma]|uniref:Nuclease A inhibitor family protein n=1 Tax=Spirosoma liriopis TaxID=2937440 RepID=A0ABT0HPF3_9BACT|nr:MULTISPECIES: nuclease A inhibitor family protein [Spirosoma]MCK8494057.1 nuclease A inhibitor family protein [Spirosoma liriopis]UHG89073.1 nuclease A inhibitor family protein [Spirosoma oryzicola]
MTNENSKSSDQPAENRTVSDQINSVLPDLLYPSESDEPVEFVTCYLNQEEPLTVSQIKDWQMLPPEIHVDEVPENEFWEPVITEQDWYGDEEKTRTTKFQQLKQLLEKELTDRQVFYAGQTEIDVFLLGRQANGERAGIRTKLVQT